MIEVELAELDLSCNRIRARYHLAPQPDLAEIRQTSLLSVTCGRRVVVTLAQ
jgi:hypothetical protein